MTKDEGKAVDGIVLVILTLVLALASSIVYHQTHQPLPHRPVDQLTNWGQGRAPEGNVCPPGTIRMTEPTTGLFIECFRAN